ncbi:MAG TPA: DUF72 domain-containing protein [Polyangiaceae bacterium]|nr:DUF72 domain-containing protein [Polyangiaceae bacterium]
MSAVFVGETHLPRDLRRYARQYSFLELDCEPGNIPGKARLQACADVAPEGFVFSLVVPSLVAALSTGDDAARAWKAAQQAARILSSGWWVVRTPAEIRPTRRAREELGGLFKRLQEDGRRVAWEPGGLWEANAAGDTADGFGVHLVQDVAREEPRPGPVLYTRLLALGRGVRVGLSLADRVAERALAFEQAFIAVEGKGAQEIQKALAAAGELTSGPALEEELDDPGAAIDTHERADEEADSDEDEDAEGEPEDSDEFEDE